MNKLILAATLIALSSAASAGPHDTTPGTPAVWNGTSGNFKTCKFTQNLPGTMVLNNSVWTVSVDAKIILKVRGTNNVKIKSDNKLRLASNNNVVDGATVNYIGSSVNAHGHASNVNINPNEIAIGPISSRGGEKQLTVNLGGKATMSDEDELIANTAYKINHTVTCHQ